jgi:hypothetical protein
MSTELVALLVLTVVHLVGVAVLVVATFAGDDGGLRGWWPSDDDGGTPPADDRPRGGGPPLADAEQSSRRLRGAGTLADSHHVERRRAAEPDAPAPARTGEHRGPRTNAS